MCGPGSLRVGSALLLIQLHPARDQLRVLEGLTELARVDARGDLVDRALKLLAWLTLEAAEQGGEDRTCLRIRSLHPRGKVMVRWLRHRRRRRRPRSSDWTDDGREGGREGRLLLASGPRLDHCDANIVPGCGGVATPPCFD